MRFSRPISFFWLPLLLAAANQLSAQYYYSDILSTKELEIKQALHKKLRVRQIQANGMYPDGNEKTGYTEISYLSRQYDTLILSKNQDQQAQTTTTIYDKEGRILKQHEKQEDFENQLIYWRKPDGKIYKIENQIRDSSDEWKLKEIHLWAYDKNEIPNRMYRILNPSEAIPDTTILELKKDSSGNITEERMFRKEKETNFFYYYYDEAKQLSDIVRYNSRWKRLLPDLIFEYHKNGTIAKRMQLAGSVESTYLIWTYSYTDNGLLQEEALLDNRKQLKGTIRYQYKLD
jgi:hypothetical protein